MAVFRKKCPYYIFCVQAGEWYIPFVNTKIQAKISCVAYAGVEEEVNRVRENERGWDALNENFNSPVHRIVGEAQFICVFDGEKPRFTQR